MYRTSVFVAALVFLQSRFTNEKAIEPLLRRVFGETPIQEPTWFCINRLKADKAWKTLRTPGYPKSLNMKHSRCTWKISAPGKMSIRLAFRGIGLSAVDSEHCSSNYLEIIDEELGKSQARLCGRKTAGDFVSKGNKLRMDLQRDPSDLYQRGFSLSYMATKLKPGFYAKKTFNEKPLPPLKRPKTDETTKEGTSKKEKDQPKKSKNSKNDESRNYVISSDGLLIQSYSNGGRTDNSRFKKMRSGEGGSGQLSTLAIVGIVVGALFGLLIVVLVVRKILTKDKKEKDDDDGVLKNSGLPKMNMTQEKVVNAKRNILSPNVVVQRKDGQILTAFTESPFEASAKWSSAHSVSEDTNPPPDYRKISNAGGHLDHAVKTIPRNASRRQDSTRCENGIVNDTYEDYAPRKDARLQHFPSQHEQGRRNAKKRSLSVVSPAKKVPYRYNTHRVHGPDQKKAIEALNNEKFCKYEIAHGSRTRQQAKPAIPARRSRSFGHREHGAEPKRPKTRRRSVQEDLSASESERFHASLEELPRRRSQPPQFPLYREWELPGRQHHNEKTKEHLRSDKSRTWDARDKPPAMFPKKRQKSKGEPRESSLKKSKKEGYLNEKDYQMVGLTKTRSRFICDPPSPSLPRHVVPASRG